MTDKVFDDLVVEADKITNIAEELLIEVRKLTKERNDLWDIIDDIDTLDDSCRGSDRKFRMNTRKHVKRRIDILESNGHALYRPEDRDLYNTKIERKVL